LTDLDEKLAWAVANDAEAHAIGRRGRLFARAHLRIEDAYCYHLLALTRFAALQKFQPQVHKGMERVDTMGTKEDCKCPDRLPAERKRSKRKVKPPANAEGEPVAVGGVKGTANKALMTAPHTSPASKDEL
jgi:hypothetical protein